MASPLISLLLRQRIHTLEFRETKTRIFPILSRCFGQSEELGGFLCWVSEKFESCFLGFVESLYMLHGFSR